VDIIEKIRKKMRETKRSSPLDFLFKQVEEEPAEKHDEPEGSPGLLNITHLGEVPLESLSTPVEREVIELTTTDEVRIRYLKLIVALLESSNYDAAISAIVELKEGD